VHLRIYQIDGYAYLHAWLTERLLLKDLNFKENSKTCRHIMRRYRPHHDYFSFASRDSNGGNRMATVLMYLTDVTEGGETVFPQVAKADHQTLENGWSNCSLQVRVGPDRSANTESTSAGCLLMLLLLRCMTFDGMQLRLGIGSCTV
jgi:hypothetical protein